MSGVALGIDLGTTNSLAAIYTDDGSIEVVADQSGNQLLPSAISISDKAEILVGRAAKSRLVSASEDSVAAFKRAMGSKKTFKLGKTEYTPVELSTIVLQELFTIVRSAKPQVEIDTVVITVPAYFNSIQREQTLAAADLAGLENVRLINEPTAAALAYGLQDRTAESTFVVLDLGGGTFDVSVLEMFDGVMEVRASSGDAFLGGEDFTARLGANIAEQIGLDFSELGSDQKELIFATAESLKTALSERDEATTQIPIAEKPMSISITRSQFETICSDLTARMRKPIERCLYDAKIGIDEVDRVLLVGGSTRMPLVRSLASKLFRKLPERGLDPDQVVAMGAAVQAGLMQKNAALEDVVMTDVAPFSLGIRSQNQTMAGTIRDAFVPIIERNTTIPASREQYFSTIMPNQIEIRVEVYQGEAPFAKDNIMLGALNIDVPPAPAGHEGISVRFSYDVNGLLEVDVTSLSTKQRKSIVIEGGAKTLSPADRAASLKRLSAIKFHPRENAQNQEIIEELNALYAMHLGEDRQRISGLIAQFLGTLDSQDEKKIIKAREQVKRDIEFIKQNYVT